MSGDESVDGSVGSRSIASAMAGKKPLWAIGGVFPKKRRQRRSTATSEEPGPIRRRSTLQPPEARKASISGGSVPGHRLSLRSSRQSSQPPSSSSRPPRTFIEPIAGGETPGSEVIESDLETDRDWTAAERPDPFEEVRQTQSRPRPLDVVVSNDSGRSREGDATQGSSKRDSTAPPDGREKPDDLEKVPSHGSSPTIFGEGPPDAGEKEQGAAEPDADDLQYERDAEDGHKAGNTGQALGGKLDQRADEWEDDTGDDLPIRNRWGTIRYALREPMAEFLGKSARLRPA